MVNPIQRPNATILIHARSEKAPAKRAAGGVAWASSHCPTPRYVRSWKTNMLTPASTSMSILSWNGVLWMYSVALDVNMASPVIVATMNAIQVSGSTSLASWVTGLFSEARPSRRRSTTAMEPSTSAIASTCTLSSHGNAMALERMLSANEVSYTHWANSSTIIPPQKSFAAGHARTQREARQYAVT